MAKTFFLTGGTGFIGRGIIDSLIARGDSAVVVSRDAQRAQKSLPKSVTVVEGDPVYAGNWQKAVAGCDAVINLAGASIAGQRWDARYKQILRDSRVDCTRNVVSAVAGCAEDQRPKVLVSASGADYYPFAMDEGKNRSFGEDDPIDETTTVGESFLARLCLEWEHEAKLAGRHGVRVVMMRTGIVLGDGGALDKMALPFKFFGGGKLGHGRQWVAWIHITDAVSAFLFAADQKDVVGPVNVVSPRPVRNSEFSAALGSALGRPSWLPAPKLGIKLAVGEFAEYILKGRKTVPGVLQGADFDFQFPTIQDALQDALKTG